MAAMTEASTIQAALVDRLTEPDLGWSSVAGNELDRDETGPLVESDAVEALLKFNPSIAADPERVEQILPKLRAVILSVASEGLVPANELMARWLRGLETHQFVGAKQAEPIKLVDFEDPANNKLVVSTEVTYKVGAATPRRYDLVLWVNGFPLVVGETKTPFGDPSKGQQKSWLNGARDINTVYEVETPGFFVPNVFSFATEGKDFHFGPVGLPAEMWQPWGDTDEERPPLGLARALHSAERLLAPQMVLEMLRTYSLYSTVRIGQSAQAVKIVARYPQVEGVEALVMRAKDPERKQGLIWQHQGSGKTFLAAFACGKLRREMPGSTVLVLLDRLDLTEQSTREFESAGVERIKVAETKDQLQTMLAGGQRGVIITTIFRFADADELSRREDIVALIDEAHRTQEGTLGHDMRRALPNATYIGMTGTAISEKDRDTFENFGHPDDPDQVLARYTPEQSIQDGATLELMVESPRPDLRLDKQALDQAFDEMAEQEGLTEEEKELLARKATRVKTLFKADARVKAICADIVDHYYAKLAPLGMKAQVVAFDRELCVLYQNEIQRLLDEGGEGDESTVVMTVNDKEDPEEWRQYDRDRASEAKVKARFRDAHEPLKFLIVTAKLLTGFDAPIEGVMYLDKPLRKHTLFQALTRTNRRWTNPDTGQEKTHGLIVDYIGLGKEIAEAMQVKRRAGEKDPHSLDVLKEELKASVAETLERFKGIDTADTGFQALSEAQERMPDQGGRDDFARDFLKVQALFELIWPDEELRPIRDSYRWLAKVYESIQPAMTSDALLWQRLGAKTLELVNQHVVDVDVRGAGVERVTIDEETLKALRELGIEPAEEGEKKNEPAPPDAEQIIDSIEERIKQRLAGEKENKKYKSLAERLDKLRQAQLSEAADSIEFLKQLLAVARDVVAADRELGAEQGETGAVGPGEQASLLPEERIGALTQIFREYRPDDAPEIIERVVKEIDSVVMGSRFSRWQESREGTRLVKTEIRKALQKFGLPATGELFDRAYAYVAEHY